MANWYDGTVLAGHAHRQQHGFDTWDNEQWREVYPVRPPNDVHDRDHASRLKHEFGHQHLCPRGQQMSAPHDHAACVLAWLEVTV